MPNLYTFATQSGNIPLGELDANFAEVNQRVNTANYVVNSNQANITDVGTLNSLSVYGNVSAGNMSVGNIATSNVRATGILSATGNITGSYLFGDGGFLSNVTSTSNVAATRIANGVSSISIDSSGGNATVQINGIANLAVFRSTGVSVSGLANVTGNVDAGNLRTTGIVSAAGNVLATSMILSGSAFAATANISGNVTAGNVATNGQVNAVGNIIGANVRASGTVSAQGNITANAGSFFLGNGSQLTGIVSSYGNANVVTLLSDLGTNVVSTTGNVTGAYLFGNGSQLTGIVSSYGNANVVTLLSAFGSNTISTTGNITGGNISATNHTGTTVSVNSNITGGNILTNGLVSAGGNVTVAGYTLASVGTGIAAAGTVQGNATALTKQINIVSTVSSGQGVVLPTAVAGMTVYVTNSSGNSLFVYPASGAAIDTRSTNVALTQGAYLTVQYIAPTSTQWYSVGAVFASLANTAYYA